MTRSCNCEEWLKNVVQIESDPCCSAHSGVPMYYGVRITHCPWCGTELHLVKDSKDEQLGKKAKK